MQYIHILLSVQDNNLSKSQWFFTKFDMCIDIVETASSKFRQFLTIICPRHDNGGVLSFHVLFSECYDCLIFPRKRPDTNGMLVGWVGI